MFRPGSNFAGDLPRIAAGTLGLASLAVAFWPFTVDDAYIVARYAANLAAGHGYAMNPGRVTDGVTGPLWLVPMWVACKLGLSPIAVAKVVGWICGATAVLLVVHRVAGRRGGRGAATLVLLGAIAQPSLVGWSVAGLETGAATLATTLLVLAATARPRPAPWLAGACAAALAWLRPELALLVAALVLWLALRRSVRAALALLACAAAGAATVCAFRYLSFGHLLPMAQAAKAGGLAQGLHYAATATWLCTSLVGLALCVHALRHGRTDDRAWVLAFAVHLAAIALAGGDWMPGYRLLVPLLPIYLGVVGVSASRILLRGRAVPALALWLLACSVPALDLVVRVPEVRDAGHRRETVGRELASFIRQNGRTVALVDVGYLAYTSGVEVVDLGGLTDATIAAAPGGHLDKRIDADYLRSRQPDLLVMHSSARPVIGPGGSLRGYRGYPVERRVLAMPWVERAFSAVRVFTYAPRDPQYHYVVLDRAGSQGEAVGEGDEGDAE